MKIELILPLPVTLNKLTYNNNSKNGGKGGRSKTMAAKQWRVAAMAEAIIPMQKYRAICDSNIQERTRCWDIRKKNYALHKLHDNHMSLSYAVTYRYWFESERHALPRDIFNYEKQLSDFLVDMGFILDDSFIDNGRVIRAGTDPKNPRVEIEIYSLDMCKSE